MARRIALGRRVEGNAPYQSAGFAPGRSTGRAGCPQPAATNKNRKGKRNMKVKPTKEQIADLKRLASALPGGLGSGSLGV